MMLAVIDPAAGSLTVYNCGHPPSARGSAAGSGCPRRGRRAVTRRRGSPAVDVPAQALPLRLMALGGTSGAERTVAARSPGTPSCCTPTM